MNMPRADPEVSPGEVPKPYNEAPECQQQTHSSGFFYNSHLLAVVPFVTDARNWDHSPTIPDSKEASGMWMAVKRGEEVGDHMETYFQNMSLKRKALADIVDNEDPLESCKRNKRAPGFHSALPLNPGLFGFSPGANTIPQTQRRRYKCKPKRSPQVKPYSDLHFSHMEELEHHSHHQ
ncbi:unnamed protein product [Ilex paraguariensis]|uniref:Uncharacterized protein n=1 Tax=Ilex paraguariensis TaxID=185542 RepID=A0ABC8UZD1_9AQUA